MPAHVQSQLCFREKGFGLLALAALEPPLARVDGLVPLEVAAVAEGAWAFITGVGLLASMDSAKEGEK